jgi:hypothetical protein
MSLGRFDVRVRPLSRSVRLIELRIGIAARSLGGIGLFDGSIRLSDRGIGLSDRGIGLSDRGIGLSDGGIGVSDWSIELTDVRIKLLKRRLRCCKTGIGGGAAARELGAISSIGSSAMGTWLAPGARVRTSTAGSGPS